jgi:leucyl aminopeptidase (aminopeptidase T)
MPGIGRVSFETGGMTADYNALQKEISAMGVLFRRKRRVRVSSPSGTDIDFLTGGRWVLEDNGVCNRPGQIANLPAGKVFVFPKEGSMNGTIVVDGSWEGILLEEPLSLTIEKGVVINISGGDIAKEIEESFEMAKSGLRSSKKDLIWTVAEFGFGMNPKATKLVGNRVEDLVIRGGAYFGFGDNTHLGGYARVGIHQRGTIRAPEVLLEETSLISSGKVSVR